MNLARHFDTASQLSPKSAAIASRFLLKSKALFAPEVIRALHAFLQTQSSRSEELSGSDLMMLINHDIQTPSALRFIFETPNHRMAREWVESVMEDRALRK